MCGTSGTCEGYTAIYNWMKMAWKRIFGEEHVPNVDGYKPQVLMLYVEIPIFQVLQYNYLLYCKNNWANPC
jgi:hypothetical protein